MMILVSFSCTCFLTVLQSQYSLATRHSSSDVVPINKWIVGTEYSKKYYLPPLIFIIEDDDFGEHDKAHRDINNKFNNNEGHTSSIEYNSKTDNTNSSFNPIKMINNDVIKDVNLTSATKSLNSTISKKFNDQSNETETEIMRCTDKNERYPNPGSCDSYFECQNGKAEKKQCPDGLRYNPNVQLNVSPCQYPADVQCAPGSTLQPSKPTDVCPNQFGYYKTMDRYNCSSFRVCENGIGYDYICPVGLAFSSSTYRCEWPDKVPECDVEALYGHRCPEVPNSRNVNVSRSYRSSNDCRIYYTCINRKPRRLECSEYFGFDEISQACVPAYHVSVCAQEQQRLAARFVRTNSKGEYVVRDSDEAYLNDRFEDIRFIPAVRKRPVVIS